MIKGEEIKKLIVNPAIAGDHHIDDLKLLIEKYSYCGSLYFIYLKAIANVKHVDFESQLKIAAAHVSDREHLYHLINSASNKDPLNEEDNLESDSNKVELTEKLSNQEKDITEEEGSIETITKINVNNEIEKLDETQLEENIQSHALNVAFEHSAKTSIRNNEREKKDTTKKVDFTQSISDVSKRSTKEETAEGELEEEIKTKKVITASSKSIKKSASSTEGMSFIEWLNFKKTAGSKTPLKNKKNESSKNLKKEIKTKSKSNSKSGINDLLDKFINEQPSISKPVKEFYNPSTNAKKSIEESTDLVSETLAKIHFMQGNYKKAISAYKKLSLLYPEKRAFFASQIEKIKDKQSH